MQDDDIDYAPLRQYLSGLAPLTEAEWETYKTMLYVRHFEKRAVFHAAGTVCETIGFLQQGCFRWVKKLDGEARTFDFAIEHEFVTNYHSIITRTPASVDIIAVEKSVMLCIDAPKMLALFDSGYHWQIIGRKLAEYVACYSLERLIATYYDTPKMRYDKLMETAPELFLRIPHHILANYLGMTKETLSRLRNPYQ